ncbi:AraC family transcriptional regulator [Pseudonocardia sp. MH-G8]|nr:AraC family transcriptional regulator [Pseudonocardia sp. MH-G8]
MDRSSMIEPDGIGGGRTPVLGTYELCRATRFDAFRESLNSVFYPAKVETTGHGGVLSRSLLTATDLTHLTLGFVRFGTETRLDPGALGAYHVNVAITGFVESHCGTQSIVARPGTAAVFTPQEHTYLPRWGADAGQLCIKINRRSLESELEAMVGRPVSSWVRFPIGFDLTTPAGRSWSSTVELLLTELDSENSLARRSVGYREQLERLVISSLLRAQPHDFYDAIYAEHAPARSRTVKRVVDALEAAPEKPWPLSDMAELAGVSGRRLQQGFREQMGMTPTVYLRLVRLDRAHRDLTTGAGSVTDIALRWGFNHLGRFADAYRERFGCTPSESLRAGRA